MENNMIDSISISENFEQNLRERFFLEREMELLPSCTNKGKKNKSQQKILEDQFIQRVLSDPYFSIYVCKEIERRGFDLKDAFAYINYVVIENYLSISSLLNNCKNEDKEVNLESSQDGLTTEYISLKYSSFYDDQKNECQKAVGALPFRREGIHHRWRDDSLFSWDAVMEIPYYSPLRSETEKIDNEGNKREHIKRMQIHETNKTLENFGDIVDFRDEHRFMFENFDSYFRDFDQSEYRFFNVPLLAFLNFNNEFIVRIKSLLEEYDFQKAMDDNDVSKFLKFYTDSVFISQFYWFSSLDHIHMLSLLNGYYDEQEISFKTKNLNVFPNSKVLHYSIYSNIQELYKERNHDEAIRILGSLEETTDDILLKYLCVSLIGDIYQEKNDFTCAAKYLQKAYELSRRDVLQNEKNAHFSLNQDRVDRSYRISDKPYVQYIDLFNTAEMYHSSGDKAKANKSLQKLNGELKIFSIPKQITIWQNIALSCFERQERTASAICGKIIALANIFNESKSNYLEKDVEEIFDYSTWYNEQTAEDIFNHSAWYKNVTRIDCITESINDIKERAEGTLKRLSYPIEELNADTFVVNDFFGATSLSRYKKDGTVLRMLRSLGISDSVSEIDHITSFTIEPNKLLSKLASAMDYMKSVNLDETLNPSILSNYDALQRLKLEQARCYYVLKKYDTAQCLLDDIVNSSHEDNVLFNAYSMQGIIFAKRRMIEKCVSQFKSAIDIGYKFRSEWLEMWCELTEDHRAKPYLYLNKLIEYCRDELLSPLDKKTFIRILDEVVNWINSTQKDCSYKDNAFLHAVSIFNQVGLTDEALHFIEQGLLVEDELIRFKLLEEKAYIKYLEGDLDSAQEILDNIVTEAVRTEKRETKKPEYNKLLASLSHKAAIISGKRLDFKNAENYMVTAIAFLNDCEDSVDTTKVKTYESLKDVYLNLSRNAINYNKIVDKDVVAIFKTGERLLSEPLLLLNSEKSDYSFALAEYGKAIETALYNVIIADLRKYIFSKYGTPIEDKYFIGKGKFENKGICDISPKGLMNALNCKEGRTISLGSWKIFIQEEVFGQKPFKNPYIEESYEFLRNYLKESEWNALVENCAVIAEYRNGSSHYGMKSLDYVLDKRTDAIRKVNEIIDILYK